ncbi:MAG: hypothetical protein HY959_14365 [Ignavibacteriae bacterium]|nr:hypothetical protein [Ignavibacteriota bacterium]
MIFKKIKAKQDDVFKNKLELAGKAKEIFKSTGAFSTYPFIGALISIILFILFIMISKGSGIVVLALLIWLFLNNLITAYFNSAAAACTRLVSNGKSAGFGDGIKEANKRFSQLVNWAFLNTFAGPFMGMFSDIKLTKKFSGEYAWGLVSSFIIPFIVFENRDTGAGIEESQKLIKKNWGKNAQGEYKLSFISFLPFLITLFLLILSSVMKDEFITYSLIVLTIFVLIAGMMINFILRTIFFTTLYLNIKGKSK